ncbi:hypothetical protein CDES_11230 [Corynebacterium deserti GIMN1.010]|uniref:Secreted protein n=1 Tax=Corynebacterium deserti GIMN1.010 TaxID=931089 RepID=A0A0M3QA35_9CORY|nr:hypothetical protein CDES_11230 [Corynebacterium deserti GIMN1.010]
MVKNKLVILPVLIGALGLSSCSSEATAPPLEAEPLFDLLISPSETGLNNVTDGNDVSLTGEPIDLTVVHGSEDVEGACGEALQAIEGTEVPTVATASRVFSSGDSQIGVALYSTPEDNELSPMSLYADVVDNCTEPVAAGDNTNYIFTPVDGGPNGATGYVLDIEVTADNRGSSVMLIQEVGNHHVVVAGIQASEEDTIRVFEAQRDKLEEGLAA